jgi:hypothetical protein
LQAFTCSSCPLTFVCACVQHTVLVGGELSASWFSQTPPMLWPAKVGQTKPLNKTRDFIDVSDPEYLRGLGAKFQADMNGRVTCILSQSEKTLRHTRLKKEEADEVASLRTPRTAQDEQILEAALRQLQVMMTFDVLACNLSVAVSWRELFRM